jgi:glutamate/tyrosine decarboxylase-like PLP-dependent enzyme
MLSARSRPEPPVNPLLDDAARRAADYLDGLATRGVAPSAAAVDRLQTLDEPLPDQPRDPHEVLRRLDEIGSPATAAMAGSRFFGFVTGGALPAALAANWLATAWDQNAALASPTHGVAAFEAVALRWLLDVLALPPGCAGAFVTGATQANLCGLAAARHAVLRRAGWDVEADGLFGAPPITVVVGAEAHPTLFKALGVLGLGRNRVVRVETDDQGRMRPERMPTLSGPTVVCTQAGNVNTGAFDPIGVLVEEAHTADAWVHVDGAFGLWAAAAPSLRPLTAGIATADSWATDAHKWLNVPYDSGLAFVRDVDSLRAAMAVTAAYLPKHGSVRSPSDYTPELSRRARGVDVWAALSALGRARRRGPDRALLPACAAFRGRAACGGLRGAERGRAQPGAGRVRRRGDDAAGDRRTAARRHLLVRRDRMARPHRDADQRELVGDDGGGRRGERDRDPTGRGGLRGGGRTRVGPRACRSSARATLRHAFVPAGHLPLCVARMAADTPFIAAALTPYAKEPT